ncbi:MAG: hypothetical protein H7X86_13125, partial [Gorillibacterium sp.]|nr:hypothetical protein [Gorillibacterium sp.]
APPTQGPVAPPAPTAKCLAARYWNAEAVDTLLWERVKATLTRVLGKEPQLLLPGTTSCSSSDRAPLPEISRLTARCGKLEERRRKLVDLYLSEGIDRLNYDRKLEDLREEEARLNQQIAQLVQMERDNESLTRSLHNLLRMHGNEWDVFLQKVETMLETASVPLKLMIVENMVDSIHFQKELKITINYGLGADEQ